MLRRFISRVVAIALPVVGAVTLLPQTGNAQTSQFVCATDTASGNVPTTYAIVPDGQIPIFAWTSTDFPPPWTPMRRCQEVSQRMTQHNNAGNLEYITTGYVNGQPVICASNACRPDGSNLLYTLKPGQDPAEELEKLLAHRAGASNAPLAQSTGGGKTLSLKQYLRTAPVEPVAEAPVAPASPPPQSSPASPTPTW